MRISRRDFVRSAAVAAAAATAKNAAAKPRRVESLAVDGGPKAITLPEDRHLTSIKWPRYGEEEKRYISELLDNNRFYDEIPQLEQATREYLGVKHVKAHCNGTSALVSMFFALNLPRGSEILVPSYTAWATVAPMWLFGYVPVFVDINPRTACFDLGSAKRKLTPLCRALVVMHAWGLPCEMEPICDFGRKHGLIVLEDSAQAQGATIRGKQMGTWGAIGIFSFQASKVLPAVEGGMGVYQTPEYFERAMAFGNYDLPGLPGESPYYAYKGTGFGSKFRIHPIAAALARTQLKGLDQRNALITAQLRKLNDRLTQLPGLSEQQAAPEMRRVHWAANLLFFDESKAGFSKETLLKALKAEGVRASGAPYDEQHQYRLYSEAKWWHHPPQIPARLPGCEQVNKSSVRLPVFTESAPELVDQYAKAFEKIWAHRDALGKA